MIFDNLGYLLGLDFSRLPVELVEFSTRAFEAQTLSQNSATEPFPTTIDYKTSRIIRLVTRHWLLPDTKQVHWANLIASPNFQF